MNICIFGDSIAWGAKDYDKGGWVERLKTYCLKNLKDVSVYNLSIFGESTEGLLKRFEIEAVTRKPELIIFAEGINDALYIRTKDYRNVDLDKFKSNLSELAKIGKNIEANVIFVGLIQVDETMTMPRPYGVRDRYFENKSIEKYDEAIKELCEKNSLEYVGLKEIIKIDDLEDGLHPNSQGHEKIFKSILKSIEKYLK
jgi:lysophospholipase L1-like esterase